MQNFGNTPVGSDEHGTYIDFTGISGQYLQFASSVLNLSEFEIYIKIGNMKTTGGNDPTILDGRPTQVNGQYLVTGYSPTNPFDTYIYYNNSYWLRGETTITNQPCEIVTVIKPNSTQILVDGSLYASKEVGMTLVPQTYKLGKNIFEDRGAPPLVGRVYRLEFRPCRS